MIRIIKKWYEPLTKSDKEQVTYSNLMQYDQDACLRRPKGWELDPDITYAFKNHPWKYSQKKIAAIWMKKREGE